MSPISQILPNLGFNVSMPIPDSEYSETASIVVDSLVSIGNQALDTCQSAATEAVYRDMTDETENQEAEKQARIRPLCHRH